MTTSEIELECGYRGSGRGGATSEEEEEEVEEEADNGCFSDGNEGSCNSHFYSTADGDCSYDDYSFACGSEILEDEGLECKRISSSATDPYEDDDLESAGPGKKLRMKRFERDCRICHLSLVSSSPSSGVAIQLGCSCKDDLAAAHKQCAETWFKIKGNKTCEICNSVARNVVGPNDIESALQASEASGAPAAATSAPTAASATETPSCLNGHRFLNFLLACMVFAFVISWLFHFNIPS